MLSFYYSNSGRGGEQGLEEGGKRRQRREGGEEGKVRNWPQSVGVRALQMMED